MVRVILALTLAATALAVSAPPRRLEEMKEKVSGIVSTATTDEKGLVSPAEYGRLMHEIIKNVGRLKYLEDYPGLVEEYIETLTGPMDPSNILDDFILGGFSNMIMNPQVMRRRLRKDL